jgi:hypothetical protein
MRYLPFVLWLSVSVCILFMAFSNYAFNDEPNAGKLFGLRVLCAVFWPLALFSTRGRQLIHSLIKGI